MANARVGVEGSYRQHASEVAETSGCSRSASGQLKSMEELKEDGFRCQRLANEEIRLSGGINKCIKVLLHTSNERML